MYKPSIPDLILRITAIILVLGVMAIYSRAAESAPLSCRDAVKSLGAEWDAIGYPEASKPMEAVVLGRNGHENSGSDIRYMRTEIRHAVEDCDVGRNDAALRRVEAVQSLLDRKSIAPQNLTAQSPAHAAP